MKGRVAVGLSGGVDSSVAAWLLKQQGYDVLGVFMKNWDDDDNTDQCTARQDFLDVLAVADELDIQVEAVHFAAEYKERVFSHFLAEYQAGRTPNPDVLCNSEIKFKAFLEDAMRRGADYIATGHYVGRATDVAGRAALLRGGDASKDQSYFLYRLNQSQLRPTLFPLSELSKPEVRRIAEEIRLPNAAKKDSTGICFIGERNFRDFLERYLPKAPGDMRTPDGKRVGQHLGLMYYTLGQRQGLGIGGKKDMEDHPWYVADKDMASNTLIVVQGHDHPALLSNELTAKELSWISGEPPNPSLRYTAKTRYRQTDAPCHVRLSDNGMMHIVFEAAQWAVTPGQSIVLYDGRTCLGGGIIC
jgi:tRNA-uridine 2-sulfurtransferase